MGHRRTEITITCGSAPPLKHVLPPGEYVIGHDPSADLRISGDGVAALHAKLSLNFNEWLVENLAEPGGTFVNGEKIADARVIFPTQKIRVGAATIALRQLRNPADPVDEYGSQTDTVRALLPDEILGDGKYALGPVVGRGGMGVILDAHEIAAQRNVAMKLMLECSKPGDIGRFVLEAQITAQLEHPNIVPVHELGVNELDQPFYTMKFVRGVSLGRVLELLTLDDPATVEKYPLSALLTIFQKICDAIGFAHSRGVIHRDLKPENIMLGEYGEALVMDWGLAKMLGRDASPIPEIGSGAPVRPSRVWSGDASVSSSAPTVVGTVMGTLAYMSPEQANGEIEQLDARTDIYALGAMLYHLLTLRPPLVGDGDELLANVRAGSIVRPAESLGVKKLPHLPGGRVPESVAAVAMKALARDPRDRYATVAELQSDIAAYQGGFATGAENASSWKLLRLFFHRHRTVSIAAAAVLLSAGFFTLKFLQARERTEAAKRFANEQRDTAEEHSYVSHLLDTGRHLAEGYPENARELLQRHRQEPSGRDLRGWEWFHLLGQLNQDRLQVQAHPGGVFAVAARADGAQIVTGGADGEIAVWRTRGLFPEFRLRAHAGPVHAVAWHGAGQMLASGGEDGVVRVWDVATKKQLAEISVDSVQALAWQPEDGGKPRLAIGGRKQGVLLWNPPLNGAPAVTEGLHRSAQVSALHWSADGTRLAIGTVEGRNPIKVEDFRGRGPFAVAPQAGNDVFSIAFEPTGRYVAAGDKHLRVTVVEVGRGETFSESLHHGPVSALAWSPDGRRLASASHDRTIRLFTPGEPHGERRMFTGHTGEINALAWTRPAGAGEAGVLFSGGADGTLRAWRPTMADEKSLVARLDNWIATARWSPDGRRVAVTDFDPQVEVLTPEPGGKRASFRTKSNAFDVDWSHVGDRLAVAERQADQIELLDSTSGKSLGTFKLEGADRVAWSPSDKYLAAASPTGVRVWDVAAGREVATIQRAAGSIAWSADERRLAVGGHDGAVEIWDALAGRLLATWRPAPPAASGTVSSEHEPPRIVFDLGWSPDERSLAFVTQDSVAGLLSARDGRLVRTFTGHGGGIRGVSWSPDGRRLATCGADGVLFVFNAGTGDQVAQIMRAASGNELHTVAWSPDGRRLLSGGYDTALRIWDAVRGDQIDAAARLENRLRLAPEDLAGWRELAAVCTRLGWAGRAREAFARAQALAPQDADLAAAARQAETEFEQTFGGPAK